MQSTLVAQVSAVKILRIFVPQQTLTKINLRFSESFALQQKFSSPERLFWFATSATPLCLPPSTLADICRQ